MPSPRLSRRHVVSGLLGLVGTPLFVSAGAAGSKTLYVGGARTPDGTYVAAIMDEAGMVVMRQPLAGRAHDSAVAPDGHTVVVFARRPGRFALVIDARARKLMQAFEPAEERHFYGHGVFSRDGRLLYTTENAYETGDGRVGVYDVKAGFRRIGEFDTGGIGPHQLSLMPDGGTLVVANGGIMTHPDYGRRKLNIPQMQPSLAYLDARTGKIVEQVRLPDAQHLLSIRHLAIDKAGGVWFGMQYQGAVEDRVPLVGCHRRGEKLAPIEASLGLSARFRNYVGSVAANRDGSRIATTSPRGDAIVIWDAHSSAIVREGRLRDACGVAGTDAGGFLVTGGTGRLWDTARDTGATTDIGWDNHLRRIEG